MKNISSIQVFTLQNESSFALHSKKSSIANINLFHFIQSIKQKKHRISAVFWGFKTNFNCNKLTLV